MQPLPKKDNHAARLPHKFLNPKQTPYKTQIKPNTLQVFILIAFGDTIDEIKLDFNESLKINSAFNIKFLKIFKHDFYRSLLFVHK